MPQPHWPSVQGNSPGHCQTSPATWARIAVLEGISRIYLGRVGASKTREADKACVQLGGFVRSRRLSPHCLSQSFPVSVPRMGLRLRVTGYVLRQWGAPWPLTADSFVFLAKGSVHTLALPACAAMCQSLERTSLSCPPQIVMANPAFRSLCLHEGFGFGH